MKSKEASGAGILIAVEGLDGSGKSTQAHLLVQWLRALGAPVHHTEWNSSPMVKSATKEGKKNQRLVPETFHYIHAADFADRWERQIEPLLAVGGVVICDRYKFTAMARDGARGIDQERIEMTYSFARDPDLTLYFEVDAEISLSRIMKGRPNLKFYESGMDMGWTDDPVESYKKLQGRMREIYGEIAESGRMVRIDSNRGIAEIQKNVRRIISDSIDLSNVTLIEADDRRAEIHHYDDSTRMRYISPEGYTVLRHGVDED